MKNELQKRLIDKYVERETEKREGFLDFGVSFYVLTFGNKNQHGEIFLKGSESRTLEAFKHGEVRYYKNHERNVPGIIRNMYSDDFGLVVEADFIDTTVGRDTMIEYKTGVITQHSAGFFYVENGAIYEQDTDTIYIKDFLLKEASSLTCDASDKYAKLISLNSDNKENRKEFLKELGLINQGLNFDKFNFNF